MYNYIRGGDIADIRIYDHALGDADVSALASGGRPSSAAPVRDLSAPQWQKEWLYRYGWDRPADMPVYLSDPQTRIRKVEFTDQADMKERMTLGSDGIAETTWPGVYNRSRIAGRHDYFELPDWNVYVDGGKAVTFTLPNEPWNRLEVQGTADGTFTAITNGGEHLLATRASGQERTFNSFATLTGGKLRFDNKVQENPLQEVSAFNVTAGRAPADAQSLTYTIRPSTASYANLNELKQFVTGRFPTDERQTVLALPDGAPKGEWPATAAPSLPIVHVLIPADLRT